MLAQAVVQYVMWQKHLLCERTVCLS